MAFTNKSVFLLATILACALFSIVTGAHHTTHGSTELQAVTKEGDNPEEKKTNRPVQIVINVPAERVRALVVAGALENGSTIEETSEYKVVISKPAGEDNGYGNEPKARYLSTFIIAESEKGKSLVRLDLLLVARTRIGTMRIDLNKGSEKKRAESEKVLQKLKARSEQTEPSANPPVTPLLTTSKPS